MRHDLINLISILLDNLAGLVGGLIAFLVLGSMLEQPLFWASILIYAGILMFYKGYVVGGLIAFLVSGLIFFAVINSYLSEREFAKKRRAEKNNDKDRIREMKELVYKEYKLRIFEIESQLYSFKSEIDALDFIKETNTPLIIHNYENDFFLIEGQVDNLVDAKKEINEIIKLTTKFQLKFPYETKCSIFHTAESAKSKQLKERNLKEERTKLINKLSKNLYTRTKEDTGPDACSLYIMFTQSAYKVGISQSPKNRLKQVQTGNPEKVRILKMLWFRSTEEAKKVERTIHLKLKINKNHLNGEWFNIDEKSLLDILDDVLKELVSTSQIENLNLTPISINE